MRTLGGAGAARNHRRGLIEVAMADADPPALAAEPGGEPLGEIDRAMAAAGAAYGDRQIAFAFSLEARQERVEPGAEPFEERREIRIGLDEGADFRVAPGERTQARDVVRVAEETDIEDQVGIPREAVAIREGGDEDGDAMRRVERELAVENPLQIGRIERGRVDDKIGAVAQRRHSLPLEIDAVAHRPIARQRMAAPRLRVTANEALILAIEKDDSEIEIVIGDELVERRQKRADAEIARADIDADGERRPLRRRHEQVRQQRERQIVDRFVTHILERLERRRATGAGHAGDHEETARNWPLLGGRQRPINHRGRPVAHGVGIVAAGMAARSMRKARRSFAVAEASNGASITSGTSWSSNAQNRGSGRRSMLALGMRSTTRRNLASGTVGTRRMPRPRTSISPAMVAGAVMRNSPPLRCNSVWSSATSLAPSSMRRKARSDLPLPEGPRSRMPSPPRAIEVPWTRIMRRLGAPLQA